MTECVVCGDKNELQYNCNHCGRTFCSKHRLPEAHRCPALLKDKADQEWFDGKFEDVSEGDLFAGIKTGESDYETIDPDTKYRRRDIEPEYEHESPGLNPDGSLATDDIDDDKNKTTEKETEMSLVSRMMIVLSILVMLIVSAYLLWL